MKKSKSKTVEIGNCKITFPVDNSEKILMPDLDMDLSAAIDKCTAHELMQIWILAAELGLGKDHALFQEFSKLVCKYKDMENGGGIIDEMVHAIDMISDIDRKTFTIHMAAILSQLELKRGQKSD